jgi:hypothetical protein
MKTTALLLISSLAVISSPAFAQLRCVPKEYSQYKDQLATADGRHNMPLDYCIVAIRQRQFDSASQPYADCAAEQGKMRDAMAKAKLTKLIDYAEADCKGKHPLSGR